MIEQFQLIQGAIVGVTTKYQTNSQNKILSFTNSDEYKYLVKVRSGIDIKKRK